MRVGSLRPFQGKLAKENSFTRRVVNTVPASSYTHDMLPDFGNPAQTGNADPHNATLAVNTPMEIHYIGNDIKLSQGASKSAIAMIKHFSKPSVARSLNGRRVLELGCGTGLAGIAAIMHGAQVDFTDQSIVMDVLEDNVKKNLDSDQLESSDFYKLQWHDDNKNHPLVEINYDYLIAADVVYAKESIRPIAETMRRFSNKNTIIYLTYVHRFPWARQFFERMDENYNRTLIEQSDGVWLFQFKKITEV